MSTIYVVERISKGRGAFRGQRERNLMCAFQTSAEATQWILKQPMSGSDDGSAVDVWDYTYKVHSCDGGIDLTGRWGSA